MDNVIVRAGPDKGKHLSHVALPCVLRRAETSISMKDSSIFQGVACYANLIEENILLKKPLPWNNSKLNTIISSSLIEQDKEKICEKPN